MARQRTIQVMPSHSLTSDSKLSKILSKLGWKAGKSNLRLWHSDDASPLTYPMINFRAKSIDKQRVGELFGEVFGYEIDVIPECYVGLAVSKIQGHQRHGSVVRCPVAFPRGDRVYQKLLTNHPEETWMEEWRLDIYGHVENSLLTRKQLQKNSLGFPGPQRKPGWFHFNVPLAEAFTDPELASLEEFREAIRMDYGSLDVIRHEDDKIYVIDATTATTCPNPEWHGNCTEDQYLRRSSEAFEMAFGK